LTNELQELLTVSSITELSDKGAVTMDEAIIGMFASSVKDSSRAWDVLYRTHSQAFGRSWMGRKKNNLG
jgi:hypothetical protein